MKRKIGMVSLGCAKNLTDAETMLGILNEEGYEITARQAEADVIIVNTCGFIESAKQESIDTILEMSEFKSSGCCKVLIVTGCLSERYRDDLLAELPEVDAILGTGDYHKIAQVIKKAFDGERVSLYGNQNAEVPDHLPRITTTGGYSAYLKIAEGCDNCCTYCIIPKLRGKYRSRKMEDIISEAHDLAESGVREIILIAQDTTRYGIDIYGEHKLAELIDKLSEISKIEWIRVHYCYPEVIDEGLIKVFSENKKVCKYLDIPVQHINNDVLKAMGRKSTGESIRTLIKKLRENIEGLVIRTSIIVGFPGETEEQFGELLEFVKWAKFDHLGAFIYSKEEDTPAAKLKSQIDLGAKQARYDQIMCVQKDVIDQKLAESINSVYKILVEGYDFDRFMYFGRSYRDSIEVDSTVYFASSNELAIGSFCDVLILDSEEYDLIGVISDEFGK